MNTTIYFIRHSKTLKLKKSNYNDSDQLHNEKQPLSVDGEDRARTLSKLDELSNIDIVISSHYVRTIATAKYIAEKNNLDIYINEDFKERRQGVNWDDIPENFEKIQFYSEDYKLGDGENQIEVRNRMYNALQNILNNYNGKRVVISSHGTAMTFLFRKWCNIDLLDGVFNVKFNNEIIFNKKWDAPELFKLIFNENNQLISIENITIEYD